MIETLEQYAYLWDDRAGRYVLIQAVEGSERVETCVVYDLESKTGLIIEDDSLALQVKVRMEAAGVPILKNIPID